MEQNDSKLRLLQLAPLLSSHLSVRSLFDWIFHASVNALVYRILLFKFLQIMAYSKRPHVKTERMQEFIRAQGDANSPTKKLKCPEIGCNKMFTSAPGLKYHLQTHKTENPQFSCKKCHKVFKRYNILVYFRAFQQAAPFMAYCPFWKYRKHVCTCLQKPGLSLQIFHFKSTVDLFVILIKKKTNKFKKYILKMLDIMAYNVIMMQRCALFSFSFFV